MRKIGSIWNAIRYQKIHATRKPIPQQTEVIMCGKEVCWSYLC